MLVFAASDKGGTGRSVTSANLAYHRALAGDDVCYLDFDFGSPTAAAVFDVSHARAALEDRGLEEVLSQVGVEPTGLGDLEHMLRSLANRLGAALIVVGLLISSALMARVDHTVALVGFLLSGMLGLYMLWRIFRTPGNL